MITRRILSTAYIALLSLLVLVFIGYTYEEISPGLAAPGNGVPFYCRELLSSGGDVDATIVIFILFAMPLFIRLFRFRRGINRYEAGLFWLSVCAACLALWLASIDCASIFYTAFVVPDFMLALALIAMPASAIVLTKLRSN